MGLGGEGGPSTLPRGSREEVAVEAADELSRIWSFLRLRAEV